MYLTNYLYTRKPKNSNSSSFYKLNILGIYLIYLGNSYTEIAGLRR